MSEIVRKLAAISGMLEMLSCAEGCTVTSQMTSLLEDAVEMLDGIEDDLMKMGKMMLQIFAALALIALGMGVDAYYQRRIRIAECDAYETGYQQGVKEGRIREEARAKQVGVETANTDQQKPSMLAPVAMPDSFEEHLRKHGRATARVK